MEEDPNQQHWVPRVAAIARREEDFGALAQSAFWPVRERDPNQRVWTDDYSNIVGAILRGVGVGKPFTGRGGDRRRRPSADRQSPSASAACSTVLVSFAALPIAAPLIGAADTPAVPARPIPAAAISRQQVFHAFLSPL